MTQITSINIAVLVSKLGQISVPNGMTLTAISCELLTDNTKMLRYSLVNTSTQQSITYCEPLEDLDSQMLDENE